jgi:rubrerythrin
MNTTKDELKNLIEELSEEESRLLFKFTRWLVEQGDELTEQELALLHQGEQQFEKGEYAWWRDVKRTEL